MTLNLNGSLNSDALGRATAGRRLSEDEIIALYDLPYGDVAAAAHELRLTQTDPEIVTYPVGGNIDYTNVCVVACKFCAFYRARHQEGAYTRSFEEIGRQLDEVSRIGGADILLEGGVNPDLPFDWYLDLLRFIKARCPGLHVDAFSPEEILGLEKLTGRNAIDLLSDLKAAGMDGIPGAAAEILVDEIRRRFAPQRIMTADWLRIMDAAERNGLHVPWVGMVTGFGETRRDRVRHLLALREQQDRSLDRYGTGFTSFKVWPARFENTRAFGMVPVEDNDRIARDYLRDLAISRLALDNVANHRTVWRTMGFGVAAEALHAGANDICGTGSINAIEAVLDADGRPVCGAPEDLIGRVVECITGAGFVPALRDPFYRVLSRHERNGRPATASHG